MNDKDTANYINCFFASLTKDFPVVEDKWLSYGEMETLPVITKKSVANKLRKLKPNKAPGPNDPNVKILKILRVAQSAMLLASTMKHCLGSFSFIPL
jgi:hypothetical protein